MLRRLLTAAVLIPLVVWGVLALDGRGLGAVFALVVLAGAWEWSRLVPVHGAAQRAGFVALTAVALAAAWQLRGHFHGVVLLMGAVLAWWITALMWIRRPEHGVVEDGASRAFKGLAGLLTLVPAWLSLVVLHGDGPQGPQLVLFLLILIWVADSGAYFAGRRWGHTRLAPAVSPGKTWEGVYGAVAGAIPCAIAGGLWFDWRGRQLVAFVTVCLATVLFSIVGDLLESLCKRHQGIKDSGSLIPGHGGVLDRIDSLTAAAPVFLLGLLWMKL